MVVTAFAPGRVNLIGEHTDYTGGLVLPMAVQFGTTIRFRRGGRRVLLDSEGFEGRADVPLDIKDPAAVQPEWARYVAGVVAATRPPEGGTGTVSTTLPVGAGLSSSAALVVAVALALGFAGDPLALAASCQRAEQAASGVPCGIMDHLASVAGRPGHALLIDCSTCSVEPVPVPPGCAVVVVDSGERRRLAGSAYAERRRQCEAAQSVIGPLRAANLGSLERIDEAVIRARARHVVTENTRVAEAARCLGSGDLAGAGELMLESHASLRYDFEVSTAALDALVEQLSRTPGVHGARLTGAGFGGCVVALTEPGAIERAHRFARSWAVTPSAGASTS